MLKSILFDLDMTLVDFMSLKRVASARAASAMVKAGLKMDRKAAEKELFRFYLDTGIESNDAFERFLKKHAAYSDRLLAVALNAYLKAKYGHLKPYKGVKKTLRKLKAKGLKIGLVTDAPRLKAYMRLDEMGILGYFDAVVGFEDTGRAKPSKLPFRKALKLLKAKPPQTLMVGDWPERDIKGAQKLGIKTCWAKYGWHTGKTAKADYEINKFGELIGVVTNVIPNGNRKSN